MSIGRAAYILVWLNRTTIEEHPAVFVPIHILETLLIVVYVCMFPLCAYALWSIGPIHRNLRLGYMSYLVHGVTCMSSRLILIYSQYFEEGDWFDNQWIALASVVRNATFFFFVGLPMTISIERFFATVLWSWYEKQSKSTIFVFVFCAIIVDSFCFGIAYALIFGIISVGESFVCAQAYTALGIVVCLLLFRWNVREINSQKKYGADISTYSVARSYQIRENVSVFKILIRIVIPTALLNVPSVIFNALFLTLPESSMLIKNVCIALFDLWIPINGLAWMLVILYVDQRFEKSLQRFPATNRILKLLLMTKQPVKIFVQSTTADVYFSQLSRDLYKKNDG